MKKLLLLSLFLSVYYQISAQKVAGFIGDWHPNGTANNVQFDKLTDVYYAFMYTSSTGTTRPSTAGGYTNTLQPLVTAGHAKGVRIHISLGGANHPSADIASAVRPGNRANLINNIISTIQTYDLDGFNVDWEFPPAANANDLGQFMVELRAAMNTLGTSMGKQLELSCAVSPLLWNSDGINATFTDACDYIFVMAFDSGGGSCVEDGTNHSSMLIAQRALDKWTDKGLSGFSCGGNGAPKNVDPSKIVLAIPFYSSHPGGKYKTFSNSNPAAYYNDADGIYGGYRYNSKPMIDAKAKLIMENYGGAGIWAWELPDDRTDQYSLLGAMWDAMRPYMCAIPDPNLGTNVSICGSSSVTLDANVTGAYTYKWYKENAVISGATSRTYNAPTAGKYKVEVSNGACSVFGEIEVLGVLPAVELGDPIILCDPIAHTLDAGVSGSGMTYTWKKGSTTISGATAKTFLVNEPGTYSVEVSAQGCTSQTDQVVVTSSLLNVQGATGCATENITLSVVDNNGPYEWFTNQSDATPIHEGKTYAATYPNTTTVYVQKKETFIDQIVGPAANTFTSSRAISHFNYQKFEIKTEVTLLSIKYKAGPSGTHSQMQLLNGAKTTNQTSTSK